MAQPAPDSPAPRAPGEPGADDLRAQQLYKDGDRRYSEGRYEDAIIDFRKAYELSSKALLLYNMANTYERMGEYAKAADALRKYLGSPDSENSDAVRQRLRQLDLRAKARKDELDELDTLRARPACPSPVACPVLKRDAPSDRGAYLFLGTGGVALVSSAVFAIMARVAHNDAKDECVNISGRFCPMSAQNALDREKRFALFTDVSAALGLASIGAGTYLLFRKRRLERERQAASARIAPTFVPGGAGVGVAGYF